MAGQRAVTGRGAGDPAERRPGRSESRRDAGPRWVAAAVPGCYLAAALVLSWRLWADPATRTVAGNPTDADLFAWYLRYAADAVTQ